VQPRLTSGCVLTTLPPSSGLTILLAWLPIHHHHHIVVAVVVAVAVAVTGTLTSLPMLLQILRL
jgi:hypothetical protein